MYKTFLNTTSAVYEVEDMKNSDNSMGKFTYLGIEQGLQDCVNPILHQNHELELLFNIDGMKPYKSAVTEHFGQFYVKYIPNLMFTSCFYNCFIFRT